MTTSANEFKSKAIRVPTLPPKVTDIHGFTVDLSDDVWHLFANPDKRGLVRLDLRSLKKPRDLTTKNNNGCYPRRSSALDASLIDLFIVFLANRITSHSPISAKAVLGGFVHLEFYVATVYRWAGKKRHRFGIADLDGQFIASFARWLFKTCPENGKYVVFIRAFYKYGLELRYAGFSHRTMTKILQTRIKSPPKGHLARFLDPVKGAFSWEEQQQIIHALELEVGKPQDRAMVGLFWETGIRFAAAVRLRKSHLRESPEAGRYFLFVPRVKQRRPTSELKRFDISEKLAKLLLSVLPENAGDETFLLHWLPDVGMFQEAGRTFQRWSQDANLLTDRIERGKVTRVPLAAYRFRRTLATTLAENGADPEEIAAFLDDKTLSVALVYTYASSSIVDVLSSTLDKHPAWFRLISLFLGRIESGPEESALPQILGGAPQLAGFVECLESAGTIGSCLKSGPCDLAPPLTCYTCVHFSAKDDPAPHDAQLQQIRRDLNEKVGVESDRVAAALKPFVLAILSLIAELRERRGFVSPRTDRKTMISRQIAKDGT